MQAWAQEHAVPTGLSCVQRYVYAKDLTGYWLVRFLRARKWHQQRFTDIDYGGKAGALEAALVWRDTERPILSTRQRQERMRYLQEKRALVRQQRAIARLRKAIQHQEAIARRQQRALIVNSRACYANSVQPNAGALPTSSDDSNKR